MEHVVCVVQMTCWKLNWKTKNSKQKAMDTFSFVLSGLIDTTDTLIPLWAHRAVEQAKDEYQQFGKLHEWFKV